jgi:hypothetical protein
MKKKSLLASVAMVIAIGCTAGVAQESSTGGTGASAGHSQGSAQNRLNSDGASGTGGAMRHSQATPGGGGAQNQAIPEKQGMGPPKGTSQKRGAEENNGTNRQRGAVENNETNRQRGAEENNGTNRQRGAVENNGTNRQRDAEQNNRTNTQRGAEKNNRTNMQRGAQENERRGMNGRIQERGGRSGSAKSVQLSEKQRTQIKDIIVKDRNVARVNSTHFPVAVGTAVPHNVHVAVLPPDVVRVVPEYRGFDYVVAGGQLLIIDPGTMEIVAILPA